MVMTALQAPSVPAAPAVRARRRPRARRLVGLIGPVLFLAGWSLLALLFRNAQPEVIPAPWAVARAIPRAWEQGLGSDIVASVQVAAGGWVVGCLAALVIGVAIGRIHWIREIVNPIIEVLRPVSALAWVPLAVVWFGIGYSSKLFIVALATFFVAVVHIVQGAEAVDGRHLKAARMLSLSRRDIYRFVVIPSAVPEIMLGLRQGLGVAWGGVIIAELVAGDKGVGAMELLAQQGYDFPLVVIGMVVFALLGFAAVAVFGLVERLVFPWLAAQRRGAMAAPAPTATTARAAGRLGGLTRTGRAVLGLVLLVALWWIAAAGFHISAVVLPTPGQVATTLGNLLGQGSFWDAIWTSLVEFAIGYALAMVSAFVVSAVFVSLPVVHRALWPEIELLRFVIPFSWIPLAVLWFSTSDLGKVFIVWYAVFFTVILSTYSSLAGVDGLLLKTGRMLQLPAWRQMVQIRLRAALPRLIAGARVGLGVGWISVIAAEYIGAVNGLGVFITNAQETLDTKSVLAGMVVIGVIGAAMSGVARLLSLRLSGPRGGRR